MQHQLESAFKCKPVPSAAALVEAMFMAELESQLLTAGHDLDSLRSPLILDVSSGNDRYVTRDHRRSDRRPHRLGLWIELPT